MRPFSRRGEVEKQASEKNRCAGPGEKAELHEGRRRDHQVEGRQAERAEDEGDPSQQEHVG